ncbi:MAG TPA: hypothetical protein VKK79_10755, partial [Candidatus Lokiarchaeia archaeon]|nr:hypothetical protein [Candidatus Lokiarchaeia archaeon]
MQIHARLIALVMIVWMIVPFVGLIGISIPSRPEKNQQPRLTQMQARKPDSNAQPVAAEIALVDRNGDKIHDLLAKKMMNYA